MAPTRKSRSVYKRYSSTDEVSPLRHGESADRRNQRVSIAFIQFLKITVLIQCSISVIVLIYSRCSKKDEFGCPYPCPENNDELSENNKKFLMYVNWKIIKWIK